MYCCTIDVVERKLPITKVKYPSAREKLLELMSQDQKDRSSGKFSIDPSNPDMNLVRELVRRDDERAKKVFKILQEVQEPSVENIGLDGSRAVWIIALHSTSVDFQKSVLDMMNKIYQKDKTQVFYPGIPYLEDSLMINSAKSLKEARQLYGTRSYIDQATGKQKDFTVVDPKNLAARRKKFDLNPDPKNGCPHRSTKN